MSAGHSEETPASLLGPLPPFDIALLIRKTQLTTQDLSPEDLTAIQQRIERLDTERINLPCTPSAATLLHLAALKGYPELVRALLEKGATPHAQTSAGNTPLHLLLSEQGTTIPEEKRIEIASQLTWPNASILNLQETRHGWTPLHEAAQLGNERILTTLLECVGEEKIEINAQDKTGNTPLHVAAHHCHTPIVRKLLEAKANPHHHDDEGKTARDHARRSPKPQEQKDATLTALLQRPSALELLTAAILGRSTPPSSPHGSRPPQ